MEPQRVATTDTLLRKVWLSVAITAVFIAVTILLVAVPASRLTDPAAREYAAAIARVIVGLTVLARCLS
jgi:hypothetical protein